MMNPSFVAAAVRLFVARGGLAAQRCRLAPLLGYIALAFV